MDNWGEIVLEKFGSVNDFWILIDELIDDKSDFYYNREWILDAFMKGNLYGLRVKSYRNE